MDSQQVIHQSGDRVVRGCLVEAVPARTPDRLPGDGPRSRDLGSGSMARPPIAPWLAARPAGASRPCFPRPPTHLRRLTRTPPDDRPASGQLKNNRRTIEDATSRTTGRQRAGRFDRPSTARPCPRQGASAVTPVRDIIRRAPPSACGDGPPAIGRRIGPVEPEPETRPSCIADPASPPRSPRPDRGLTCRRRAPRAALIVGAVRRSGLADADRSHLRGPPLRRPCRDLPRPRLGRNLAVNRRRARRRRGDPQGDLAPWQAPIRSAPTPRNGPAALIARSSRRLRPARHRRGPDPHPRPADADQATESAVAPARASRACPSADARRRRGSPPPDSVTRSMTD